MFILDNNSITANELLDHRPDYVLCTYQFVQRQASIADEYDALFEEIANAEDHPAKLAATEKALKRKRPNLPLFSTVYQDLNLPIRCMVGDEIQYAKNPDGQTHKAIKRLRSRFKFLLSGSFLANRWYDAFGCMDFLDGHPFTTLPLYRRAFARKVEGRIMTDPSQSKSNRLVKFLQAMVVARPLHLLTLPNLNITEITFRLVDHSTISLVIFLVRQFFQHLHGRNSTSLGIGDKQSRAISFATLAQQVSANESMVPAKNQEYLQKIRDMELAILHETLGPDLDALDNYSESFANLVRSFADPTKKKKSKKHKADGAAGPSSSSSPADPRARSSRKRGKVRRGHADDDFVVPDCCNDKELDADYDPENESLDDENGEDQGNGAAQEEEETEEDEDDKLVEEDERQTDAQLRKTWLVKLNSLTPGEIKSPRVEAVLTTLERISRRWPGVKMLVFSKFVKFLNILEKAISIDAAEFQNAIQVYHFDGTIDSNDRELQKQAFQNCNKIAVLLISVGAGGVGLNLTAATHIIQCEPWWRESDERQAYCRAFRQGQKNDVHVWRIVGQDSSIDHALNLINIRKSEINDDIMSQLCRRDDEEPIIPRQYPQGIGED